MLPARRPRRWLRARVDLELLQSLLDGHDPGALLEFVDRVARYFVGKIERRRHLAHHGSDELAQDVLVRVWRAMASVRSQEAKRFVAWVWRVALRVTSDESRRERRVLRFVRRWPQAIGLIRRIAPGRGDALERVVDSGEEPSGDAIEHEVAAAVASAIVRLAPRERDAVLRWVVDGASLASIARDQRVAKRTTQRDVERGIRLLARVLARFRE